MQEIIDQKAKADAEMIGRCKTWLDVNSTCVAKLNKLYIEQSQSVEINESSQTTPPILDTNVPQNCTIPMFTACTSDELKGFIIAR